MQFSSQQRLLIQAALIVSVFRFSQLSVWHCLRPMAFFTVSLLHTDESE